MIDYESLRPYATKSQIIKLDALKKYGSQSKASKALNLNTRTFTRGLESLVRQAGKRGFNPEFDMTHPVADGFKLKGVSTLYNEDGQVKSQWVKSEADKERQIELVRETVLAFTENIKPCKPTKTPKTEHKNLLTSINIGDAHIGMYAWGDETGADFDCDIAQRDIGRAAHRLISSTPSTEECLIAQLGDFYHIDNKNNFTPMSGNPLDADGRFRKVIKVGILTMRHIIDEALKKYKVVRVRNVIGNHDPHAAITLDEALIGYYYKEPRVIIEDSPKTFYTYRFGSNLIGITHGHAPRPDKLAGVMAVDCQKEWAECEFKYIWHGHIHNKRVFEDLGVLVESFRTTSVNDAWHTEQGYRSGKEMQAIILDKDYGEVERHTAGLKLVRAA